MGDQPKKKRERVEFKPLGMDHPASIALLHVYSEWDELVQKNRGAMYPRRVAAILKCLLTTQADPNSNAGITTQLAAAAWAYFRNREKIGHASESNCRTRANTLRGLAAEFCVATAARMGGDEYDIMGSHGSTIFESCLHHSGHFGDPAWEKFSTQLTEQAFDHWLAARTFTPERLKKTMRVLLRAYGLTAVEAANAMKSFKVTTEHRHWLKVAADHAKAERDRDDLIAEFTEKQHLARNDSAAPRLDQDRKRRDADRKRSARQKERSARIHDERRTCRRCKGHFAFRAGARPGRPPSYCQKCRPRKSARRRNSV